MKRDQTSRHSKTALAGFLNNQAFGGAGKRTMNQRRAARFITHELALSQGYVRTPGGFRHKSFVHTLKPGQAVVKRGGKSWLMDLASKSLLEMPAAVVLAQDLAGLGGGWVTWADWMNTTGVAISSFTTAWTVPPAPATQSGQLVYLFNALEDGTGDDILQPVLQWGVSGAGGGDYWAVASWYVDSANHAFCTPAIPVNVGDRLTGLITLAIQADASHNYTCQFNGIPGTSLIAQGLFDLVQATETLEVYGLIRASDYPNSRMTAMTGIDLQIDGSPALLNWSANVMTNPAFGEHTSIVSSGTPGGEVDLCY
jgi:hypothetical protein